MAGAITRRQVRPTPTAGCEARPGRPLRPGGMGHRGHGRQGEVVVRVAPVGAGRRWQGRRRPVLDRSRRHLDGPSPGADRCRYASAQQRSRRHSSLNTSFGQRLRPVGGEPLAVLGMEPVADHLVRHHPGMPCVGQAQQRSAPPAALVYRLHVPRARRCGDRRSPTPRLWTAGSLNWCGPVSTSFASPWTIHL
jgi:hypothetical protein